MLDLVIQFSQMHCSVLSIPCSEFLHDVITHPQFASGATTTDFIEREWPSGWSSCGDEKVAVIAAAVGEKAGLHLTSTVSQSDSPDPYNPFMTIGRNFP